MAINSVASSTSADALAVAAKAQPDRTTVPNRARNQEAKSAGGQAVSATAVAAVEAPKPVVNAQGQKLGRIISTRA